LIRGEGREILKGASPLLIPLLDNLSSILSIYEVVYQGRLKGRSPFKTNSSPSCKEGIPIMERGTKGVRLINNSLYQIASIPPT